MEQQARGTRYIRAFGLFTLLAGVAVMHAVVFGMGAGMGGGMSHASAAMSTTADGLNLATGMVTSAPAEMRHAMPGCVGGECDGHAGMHGCVFVLTTLLLALGLALLGWFGLRRRESAPAKVRRPRMHRARPPPWTVLSLAELAILRI